MYGSMQAHLAAGLSEIENQGLAKNERVIDSPQNATIEVGGLRVLNLCSNNYLGLANEPSVVKAAHQALDEWGYGLASVRFICGTQQPHKLLEAKLAAFLGCEDAILYSSCFDANGGLFETLLGAEDAIVSDELNHASIIDGVRLCKAARFRYKNNDMADLEAELTKAAGARFRIVATDGVFSMDGTRADLAAICDLADRHKALVMVDDSHGVGVLGAGGRGSHEEAGVMGRIDILTGTLGKALGGASGGYVAGRAEIVAMLRQRSRPYLFSNSLAPVIAATSISVLQLLETSDVPRRKLEENTRFFREGISRLGYSVVPGTHPIVPIMIGDARRANELAQALLHQGVYVVGFSYPVVPQGKARIRAQISAAHSRHDLEFALQSFAACRPKA